MPSISGQPAADAVVRAMEIAAVAGLVGVGIVGAAIWDRTKHRKNPAGKRSRPKSRPKKRAARRFAPRSQKKHSGSKMQFARQTAEQFLGDASVAKTQANLESLQRQLDASRAKTGKVDPSAQLYMEAVAELLRKKIKTQESEDKKFNKIIQTEERAKARAAGRAPSPAVARAIAPVTHEASEREILAKYRASSYETLLKYLENIQAAIAAGGPQAAQMKHAEKNIKKVLMEKLRKNPAAYRKNPTRFDRCVRSVKASAARRGYPLKSAEGVCAAAGRRTYGKKKFQKMAAAGRKKSMRRNPSESDRLKILERSIEHQLRSANRWDSKIRFNVSNGKLVVSGKTNQGSAVGDKRYHNIHGDILVNSARPHGFSMKASGGKLIFSRTADEGIWRKNPPLMEGSAAADLQQAVAETVNAHVKRHSVRYSEIGNGDLRATGTVTLFSGDAMPIGQTTNIHFLKAGLRQDAARHGFRMGHSDGGDALLFRKL